MISMMTGEPNDPIVPTVATFGASVLDDLVLTILDNKLSGQLRLQCVILYASLGKPALDNHVQDYERRFKDAQDWWALCLIHMPPDRFDGLVDKLEYLLFSANLQPIAKEAVLVYLVQVHPNPLELLKRCADMNWKADDLAELANKFRHGELPKIWAPPADS
jgi:hypothetical protein